MIYDISYVTYPLEKPIDFGRYCSLYLESFQDYKIDVVDSGYGDESHTEAGFETYSRYLQSL